ncbi:MAG: aminoglycoside phosphotransferase family protein [Anaerolineae bacterium]|nr:aminoglycoside phosphotransferase family protein [Anaerolineae bacterium]
MTGQSTKLSDESIRKLLEQLSPNYSSYRIEPLAASYSNFTDLLIIKGADRDEQKLVVRRYNPENGDCEGKARREFAALRQLHGGDIPVPKPLFLDVEGDTLGMAGIVTDFVPGQPIFAAEDTEKWVANIDQVARMLARIHSTPFGDVPMDVLMDSNAEVSWFIRGDEPPSYMKQHPDGEMIWQFVRDGLPHIQAFDRVWVHIDYWSGNMLWHDGQISAIVDWEEAAYGDGAYDVAYALLELYLEGQDEAAERFLHIYEAARGKPVVNLGFWELAASVRTMLDLDGWLNRPGMHERFRQFIARAKKLATE